MPIKLLTLLMSWRGMVIQFTTISSKLMVLKVGAGIVEATLSAS